MDEKPKKQHYYFFTKESHSSDDFNSDEDAIKFAGDKTEIMRVMRAKDSETIWTKPE